MLSRLEGGSQGDVLGKSQDVIGGSALFIVWARREGGGARM